MLLFQWDDRFSLNIAEIDRQHRRLFDLFNELCQAIEAGQEKDVVEKVLSSVVDYTAYHFQTEEKLFEKYGYADDAAHRAEHAKLAEQTKALVQKLRAGDRHVSIATLKFLCDWLNSHIMGSDRKYAPFLIAQGVR